MLFQRTRIPMHIYGNIKIGLLLKSEIKRIREFFLLLVKKLVM